MRKGPERANSDKTKNESEKEGGGIEKILKDEIIGATGRTAQQYMQDPESVDRKFIMHEVSYIAARMLQQYLRQPTAYDTSSTSNVSVGPAIRNIAGIAETNPTEAEEMLKTLISKNKQVKELFTNAMENSSEEEERQSQLSDLEDQLEQL
ncbi:hypothetical protein HOG48_02255 [Candidatus Peregrinibacteria bacterium]|jgi:hypothetical protein|nr:hypothetical protein [Candidatus Peregrinibacteria bacterium]